MPRTRMLRAGEGSLLLMGEGQSFGCGSRVGGLELVFGVGIKLAHNCNLRPAFVSGDGREEYAGFGCCDRSYHFGLFSIFR